MGFRPKGDRARWRVVYDMLCEARVGDLIAYEALGEALDLDAVRDRHAIQMAVRRAAQEYEKANSHALDAVANAGYRVAEASEHLTLARRHQARASNELVRGHSKATNVDLSGVDEGVRRALDVVAQGFAIQMEFNRRFDVRQQRLEEAVRTVAQRAERSDEEISELRKRLARLETS